MLLHFKMTSLVLVDDASNKPPLTAVYKFSSLPPANCALNKIVSRELPPPCPGSRKRQYKQEGGYRGNSTRDGQRKRRPEPRKKLKQRPQQRCQLQKHHCSRCQPWPTPTGKRRRGTRSRDDLKGNQGDAQGGESTAKKKQEKERGGKGKEKEKARARQL